ncbi:bi-domain-containing oxidoreductase [Methylolobus aquaticus]
MQSLSDGRTEVAEVPCPAVRPGQLLIGTSRTLVSAGTERMLVDFGKANLIDKARQQPDKVRQVLEKVKTDGLAPTLEAVRNKLDQPLPMGYCNVGTVLEVGPDASGFVIGERVASNGKHAEVVSIPTNLCAKVPEGVSDDEAAFTVIGAIALQGIRLVAPTLGETVVVTGLGLIGLITVQLLRAHGCRVLGLDFDRDKLDLAARSGAEVVDLSAGQDPLAAAERFSRGRGVDAVILTAATKSSEPVHQAAQMCRKRGRIVLVGVTGLELSRADFYEKELSFQVSCSYGPGRYDPAYEEQGQDYPVGFVRWTEQRNFEAVLDMLADGRLDVKPLISHRFPIDRAVEAYDLVGGGGPSLGILLEYPGAVAAEVLRQRTVVFGPPPRPLSPRARGEEGGATTQGVAVGHCTVGLIGSGNYATAVLIPAFQSAGARLQTVASSGGVSSVHAGRKYGFQQATTDLAAVFDDPAINAVVIATRHDTHAELVQRSLASGKHVFCEKPLCLTLNELQTIDACLPPDCSGSDHAEGCAPTSSSKLPVLMVGFNRRFAPQVVKMKELLRTVAEPKAFVMTVNAGAIPAEHWTQDAAVGGGRVIGEACHFIDLLRFLAGVPISKHSVIRLDSATRDSVSLQLQFTDGSIGTVHYLANGHKSFPKERLEVFSAGRILQLDNFRKLTAFGWPGFTKMNLWRQDKGQKACAAAFVKAVEQGGVSPIPWEEVAEVSRVTIELGEQARQRRG